MAHGGKTLEQVIAIAGKLDPSLQQSIGKAERMANGMGAKMKKGAAVMAGAFAAGTAAAAAAAVAGGKYLMDIGEKFHEAQATVRAGTGATGEALDGLMGSFDKVYSSVPAEAEQAGQAIADWNTRLGVSGDTLEGLSKQAIQVADLMGEDMTGVVESSSQAFKQWNVSSDDMTGKMDYIFKVCQDTGMGFNALMGHMQSSGAVLQDLGFDFDQAASMVANLDKAGINTEQVLKGMKKGLGNVAKEGGDSVAAMHKYVEQIKGASSETEAITKATEIFGSATAVTMAQAIRTGAMDVDALTKKLQENGETINAAAEDTYSFQDRLQILGQQAEVALRPLANTIFDSLEDLLPMAEGALQVFVPLLNDAAAGAMPVIEQIVGMVSDGIQTMMPMIQDFGSQIGPILQDMATTMIPPIFDLMNELMPVVMELASAVLPVVASIMSTLAPIISTIASVIGSVMRALMPLIQPIMNLVQALLPPISGLIQGIMAILQPLIGVISGLSTVIGGIVDFIARIIDIGAGAAKIIGDIFGGGNTATADAAGFATGGFTKGISIAGEDPRYPTEAIISFNPAYRAQNVKYWNMAGALLGARSPMQVHAYATGGFTGDVGAALADTSYSIAGASSGGSVTYDLSGLVFSPNITVGEGSDESDVIEALRAYEPEFVDMILEAISKREEGAYV